MCNLRTLAVPLYLLLLHSVVAQVFAQGSSPWKTLNGNQPLVIARGGFSGLFPDSSSIAYSLAVLTSVPDVVLWCDVQLTKDNFGICSPDINLQNASDISSFFQDKNKEYLVNGVLTKGWFSVDFTLKDLANVFLNQGVYSRTNKFDGNLFPILTVQDLVKQLRPPGLWLNIQHDAFYTQHNLSMRRFVISVSRSVIVSYISSPEVNFLKSITARFIPNITKLVFRFLEKNETEPSTNQTYGSLLKNLTYIKTFSSGILVPKSYIWPVDANLYLQPHTSLVSDAHKEGLEVFASNFVNDIPLSYNYSYDPIAEYLSFIDNGDFSVDGVLSDFPITPSEAIDCFSHLDKNAKPQAKPLVISKCGASGDYPGCTDLAYAQAISDGVDVLDCPVQMSKDGTPFCLSSINLIESTNVLQLHGNLIKEIPGILPSGIFAFDLTWSQIQNLTPVISSPYAKSTMYRNPNFKNSGHFQTLYQFLALTKNTTSLSGILISIEYAAYLADEHGLSITDKVLEALAKARYDNLAAQKVMIQSSNSSVLMKLREKSSHNLVYKVDESIRDALNSTVLEIKKFADSVVVTKESVYPTNELFITSVTNVVPKLHAFKLPVYVETFSNEFLSQAWDFLSDPTVEINSFVMGANIDGVVTDFPKTSAKYKRNKCLGLGNNNTPSYMLPIEPGSLVQLITYQYLPPAESPLPVLHDSDVVEPPLPPAKSLAPTPGGGPTSTPGGGTTATPPLPSDAQPRIAACIFLSNLALLAVLLLL